MGFLKSARKAVVKLGRHIDANAERVQEVVDSLPEVDDVREAVESAARRTGVWLIEKGFWGVHATEAALNPDDVVLSGFTRIIQGDGYTCGVEATRMVLAFHGKEMSFQEAHEALGADEDNGVSEEDMKPVFASMGLRARELRKPARDALHAAIDRNEPVIVCLDNYGHWGVVYGYGGDAVYLADPSFRRATRARWSWADFKRRWNGKYGLAVGPRPKCK